MRNYKIPLSDVLHILRNEGIEIYAPVDLVQIDPEIEIPEEFTPEELYTIFLSFQYGIDIDILRSIAFPFSRIGKYTIEPEQLHRQGEWYSQEEWENFMYYAEGLGLVAHRYGYFELLMDKDRIFYPFGFIPTVKIECMGGIWNEKHRECMYETTYGVYLGERTKNIYTEYGEPINDDDYRCLAIGGVWNDKNNICEYPTKEVIQRLFESVEIPIEKILKSRKSDGFFVYSPYFPKQEITEYRYTLISNHNGEKTYLREKQKKELGRIFVSFEDSVEDMIEALTMYIVEAHNRMEMPISGREAERMVRLIVLPH